MHPCIIVSLIVASFFFHGSRLSTISLLDINYIPCKWSIGYSELAKQELWSLLENPLCERVHWTIVQLTHMFVDRKNWTERGLHKWNGVTNIAWASCLKLTIQTWSIKEKSREPLFYMFVIMLCASEYTDIILGSQQELLFCYGIVTFLQVMVTMSNASTVMEGWGTGNQGTTPGRNMPSGSHGNVH